MAKKHFWLKVSYLGKLNGISWKARAQAALELIFETLCNGGNVLVHSRQGKHRTGVVTITVLALLVNPIQPWATALDHAKDVYFAAHPNRAEHDLESRVMSIFSMTKFDVWAGQVRCEVLQYHEDYMAFAEVVYGLRSVLRPIFRGPSIASSSSMPLGPAPSGAGTGSGSMPLGVAPGGSESDSSPPLPGARPRLMATAKPQGRGPSSASSSSMPLGPAPSGVGTDSGSMTLGPAPSAAGSSSMPPGVAPGGGESDSSPPLPKAKPRLMATPKPMPKARPKPRNLLAKAARRIRERTGLVATAVPGPWFVVPDVDAVPRSHEERTALTETGAVGPTVPAMAASAVTDPRPHSAQQAAKMPPWRRDRSRSPSLHSDDYLSESESPETQDASPPPDMRDAWACPECKSTNLRFYAACRLCWLPAPFLHKPRPGDWLCGVCGNTNFACRTWCAWSTCSSRDWLCRCGNTNFARRAFCNMQSCGLPRLW